MIFLIRHAHAVDISEDPLRPLSLRGVDECIQLVHFFRVNGALPALQVWHSPLRRSQETADRLAAGLAPDSVRLEAPGLLPDDDPEEMARRLDAVPPEAAIAVVGHEPHLSRLASLLVRGKAKPVLFDFPKATVLALHRTDTATHKTGHPRWRVRWMVTPALLRSLPEDGGLRPL